MAKEQPEQQQRGVVKYESRGQEVVLTAEIVRNFLVTGKKELVTDQEIYFFLGICKARGLNPFAKDCYLIKYSQEPAAIVTAIDFYRSRAKAQKDCTGWEKGVICLQKDGTLRYSHGLVLETEEIVGGWFKGRPSAWSVPLELEVNLREFEKKTSEGKITKFWQNPAMMIMKVAESQGLRTCWPDEFQGTLGAEEVGLSSEALTIGELTPEPKGTPAPAGPAPDTSEFFALMDEKLKDMDPERQKAVAEHIRIFMTYQAAKKSTREKPVTLEMAMAAAADYFHPYVFHKKGHKMDGREQPGTWNRFLAWEAMPDKPWNQGQETQPGAEAGPAEKAEAEAAEGDEAASGEESFDDRAKRVWLMVLAKFGKLAEIKKAVGIAAQKDITPENIDQIEAKVGEGN